MFIPLPILLLEQQGCRQIKLLMKKKINSPSRSHAHTFSILGVNANNRKNNSEAANLWLHKSTEIGYYKVHVNIARYRSKIVITGPSFSLCD